MGVAGAADNQPNNLLFGTMQYLQCCICDSLFGVFGGAEVGVVNLQSLYSHINIGAQAEVVEDEKMD